MIWLIGWLDACLLGFCFVCLFGCLAGCLVVVFACVFRCLLIVVCLCVVCFPLHLLICLFSGWFASLFFIPCAGGFAAVLSSVDTVVNSEKHHCAFAYKNCLLSQLLLRGSKHD